MDVQVGDENKMPLQAVAESRMPPHLRKRLEESEKYRKMTLSADERNKITIEAQTRRDKEVARKAQKAIEIREKHYVPAEIRYYQKKADRENKMFEKMEMAAAMRESQKSETIRKARESRELKAAGTSLSTQAEDKEQSQNLKVPLNVNLEVQKKPVDEKQTMEMSQQQTMVVGGNKITFNIQINVTVQPVE